MTNIHTGVSGSDKTNKTESPNQTEKISNLVWFGLKPIRTNRNRSKFGLVHGFSFRDP